MVRLVRATRLRNFNARVTRPKAGRRLAASIDTAAIAALRSVYSDSKFKHDFRARAFLLICEIRSISSRQILCPLLDMAGYLKILNLYSFTLLF